MYFTGDYQHLAFPMIMGSLVIFAVGLIDDLADLKPMQKVVGQVLAAFVYVVMSMHTRIELAVSEFLWVTVLTVGLSIASTYLTELMVCLRELLRLWRLLVQSLLE